MDTSFASGRQHLHNPSQVQSLVQITENNESLVKLEEDHERGHANRSIDLGNRSRQEQDRGHSPY